MTHISLAHNQKLPSETNLLSVLGRFKVPHCLLVILLYMLVGQIMAPVKDWRQAMAMANQAQKPLLSHFSSHHNFNSLGSMFGNYFAGQQTLPLTTLPLNLQGVGVPAGVVSGGWALIAPTNGGDTKGYKVGDHLPGGAMIIKIEANQVVLNNGGRLERLQMRIPMAVSSGSLS